MTSSPSQTTGRIRSFSDEKRLWRTQLYGALLLAARAKKPKNRAAWTKLAEALEGRLNE